MSGQIRYDTLTLNFTVEGNTTEELVQGAADRIKEVTQGQGLYDVGFLIGPFLVSGEGAVVKWQAEVEARRVGAEAISTPRRPTVEAARPR